MMGGPPSARGRIAGSLLLAALLGACTNGGETDAAREAPPDPGAVMLRDQLAALDRETARIDSAAAAIDERFRPLPLLTPSQEAALRRFPNAAQLDRARSLGIDRGAAATEIDRLQADGVLVPLEDSSFWVVGRLDRSRALVVPGVQALLEEVGRRFHARLAEIGAPPFRFEVSSVLRTAADQAALREVNPNAALGESTHEYATTVDVLYSAFAAPVEPIVTLPPDTADAGPGPHLHRYAATAAERVAGRRALELKAVLGEVLLQVQQEGLVMVTLERQQPVFHMTLAALP